MTETFLGLNGNMFAFLGAAFALIMTGLGSGRGIRIVGQAASGVMAEEPDKFGQLLLLHVIPSTNGIYGFLIAFLILSNSGLLGGGVNLPVAQGIMLFIASMPIAIVGFITAGDQARIAAAGTNVVGKHANEVAKVMICAVLVETYQIFALLVSLLLVTSAIS